MIGEVKDADSGPILKLETQYEVLESGQFGVVVGETVQVSKAFIVNPAFDLDGFKFHVDEGHTRSFADVVHENVLPFVVGGRPLTLDNSSFVAYERTKRGLGFLSEGADDVSWTSMRDVLTHETFGQVAALESLRPHLSSIGLLENTSRGRVDEGHTSLQKPVHVYMKAEPFRDVTRINEGTMVSVVGYYQGCAVVEADGEVFWRPIEESSYYDKNQKDDWYYFSLDSNQDGIQDPLQSLPSKPALAGPANPGTNWNTQPIQQRVAGHFSPATSIANEDYAILRESSLGGVHFFYDFERLHKPKWHDVNVEPGDDPATVSHGKAIDRHMDDHSGMTAKDKKSTDRSAVPKDYSGEYDHDAKRAQDGTEVHPDAAPDEMNRPVPPEDQMEALMDEIMAGIDLDEVFARLQDGEARQKIYKTQLAAAFPGILELV